MRDSVIQFELPVIANLHYQQQNPVRQGGLPCQRPQDILLLIHHSPSSLKLCVNYTKKGSFWDADSYAVITDKISLCEMHGILARLSVGQCVRSGDDCVVGSAAPFRFHSARVPSPDLLRPPLWCGGWQALFDSSGGLWVRWGMDA